jgi:Uma2 family endonuclease
MTRQEFRDWAEGQPRRYERVYGEVVQMPAERAIHAFLKTRIWELFRDALREGGLPGRAIPDGMTAEVGPDTDYEPDAMISGGAAIDDDDFAVSDPVVVVDVLSPSTKRVDLVGKLADYFRVPTIQHYLVVRSDAREVVHHRRAEGGFIETRVVGEGTLRLDPPGIAVDVAAIFAD